MYYIEWREWGITGKTLIRLGCRDCIHSYLVCGLNDYCKDPVVWRKGRSEIEWDVIALTKVLMLIASEEKNDC